MNNVTIVLSRCFELDTKWLKLEGRPKPAEKNIDKRNLTTIILVEQMSLNIINGMERKNCWVIYQQNVQITEIKFPLTTEIFYLLYAKLIFTFDSPKLIDQRN